MKRILVIVVLVAEARSLPLGQMAVDALNFTLPELAPPVAAFMPFLPSGNWLFLSGHIAKVDGKPRVG